MRSYGRLAALLLAAALPLSLILAVAGPTSASGSAGQTTSGPELVGKGLPDGDFMVLWTPDPIAALFTPGYTSPGYIADGSLLYGTPLGISVYNPQHVPGALPVTVEQYVPSTEVIQVPRTVGNSTVLVNETVPVRLDAVWANATVPLEPLQVTSVSVDLPRTPQGTTLRVSVTAENVTWTFQHLTPDFILPVPENVGGETALAIGESLWTVVLIGIATVLARATQKRVPGIGVWRSGPLVLGGGVVGSLVGWFTYDLTIQSPQFFEVVGGTSYLLYPALFALVWYLWSQRLFSDGNATIIAHPVLGQQFSLVFNDQWRITQGPDGTDYLGRDGFGGFFWPLLGYPKEIDLRRNPNPDTPAGQEGPAQPIELRWEERGEIDARVRKARALERKLRNLGVAPPDPDRLPLPPGFPVRGLRATSMYWVDSDRSVRVEWQHLAFFAEEPRHTATGEILRDADGKPVVRRRFRPHVENEPARLVLAGRHWLDALAVALGYRSAEELSRNLEMAEQAVIIQERRIESEASRKAAERVAVLVRRTQYRHLAEDLTAELAEARELHRKATKARPQGNGSKEETEEVAGGGKAPG